MNLSFKAAFDTIHLLVENKPITKEIRSLIIGWEGITD